MINATRASASGASRRRLKAWLPLLWMLLLPFLNLFYVLLNRPGEQVHRLATAFDRALPVIPAFSVPYVLWYPFVALTLVGLFLKDRRAYYRTLGALCLGLVICYLVYACFQTTVDRPAVAGDGFFQSLMRAVYANDAPFNCFPSIHVLTSYLMLRAASSYRPALRVGIRIMAVLIMCSTLFMKQHVIADVAAGIATAELVYFACGRIQRRSRRGNAREGADTPDAAAPGRRSRKRQAG
ncbi:PAP2 superfamily protein [Paenibacillus sp. UNC496MF]|uniref:phosphatase PAP2 family protein n=1 Tax=Paenibacillus sp. UNC496MF TaxID=1502753 RepID=UPI0008E5329E|nr:phosphatase PAP2 family protein [Paenibacillus sp. UNC496MF]SFJ15447.1 PAP2 superfamily protein [Paenibacillus sp. UNC496MF]